MAKGCGCGQPFIKKNASLRGLGTDVETIKCPAGFFATGDNNTVWCENDKGERVSATLSPAGSDSSNVLLWGAVAALGLVGLGLVYSKKGR